MAAIFVFHTDKTIMQTAAVKITENDLLEIGTKETVLTRKMLIIDLDNGFKMIFHATVIIARLRVPWTVNSGGCRHDKMRCIWRNKSSSETASVPAYARYRSPAKRTFNINAQRLTLVLSIMETCTFIAVIFGADIRPLRSHQSMYLRDISISRPQAITATVYLAFIAIFGGTTARRRRRKTAPKWFTEGEAYPTGRLPACTLDTQRGGQPVRNRS